MSLNRRFDVTGLEEPEELWERLNAANEHVKALAASNKKLNARVTLLERQLTEVGGLTDDELMAELPRRMAKALESAQGVASEIIRRAHQREAAICQQASAAALALRKKVQAEAAETRRGTSADAATRIAAAEAQSQEMVSAARARRDKVLSALREQSLDYEHQIGLIRERHARLTGAFDVVERTLAEARSALNGHRDAPEASGTTEVAQISSPQATPRRIHGVGQGRERPASPNDSAPSRDTGVFDWSPSESHVG